MNASLKAVAAGDSWNVHLPLHLGTGGGLAEALFEKCLGITDYSNIAHAGDSSEESLGTGMATKLEFTLPGAGLLLWSSGGDDFAGDMLEIFLQDNTGQDTEFAINAQWFDMALDITMMDYARLVQIRDRLAPDCLIVCHSYDFPPASQMGNGFLTFGPWLKPGLVRRGWTNPDDQEAICKRMLQRFYQRQAEFASVTRNFMLVNTQGTCNSADWLNELHLTTEGCLKVAQKINLALLPWLDKLAG